MLQFLLHVKMLFLQLFLKDSIDPEFLGSRLKMFHSPEFISSRLKMFQSWLVVILNALPCSVTRLNLEQIKFHITSPYLVARIISCWLLGFKDSLIQKETSPSILFWLLHKKETLQTIKSLTIDAWSSASEITLAPLVYSWKTQPRFSLTQLVQTVLI